MIAFPAETIGLVRTIIQNSWARGIQRDSDYYGAHEFKLVGNPWHGQVWDAVRSRTLVLALLRDLYHAGWQLEASTDIMKKVTDKDTLFFTCGPAPPPSSFFAVSFNEGDKMRLIEAGEPEIIAVRNVLGPWVQREEWKVPDVAYQFQIHGYPWRAQGCEIVSTRILVLNVLNAFAAAGWVFYASIDISSGQGDTDSWFFRKTKS